MSERDQNSEAALFFDVYGYRFALRTRSAAMQRSLSSDFAMFARPDAEGPVWIDAAEDQPDYDGAPPSLLACTYTPRNTSYRDGRYTWVDYHGRALGVHDRLTGDFRITSPDPNLLYEAAYLFLLSRIGESLDRRGMHRVHALAMSWQGKAILVLLPMGGGKSTLGASLLDYRELELLSDDSPFIDHAGNVYAFPLRLGLLPGSESKFPIGHLRTVHRMEFGPKLLLDYEYLRNRVRPAAAPGYVFLGHRSLGRECEITPARMWDGLAAMLANCVVGLGLFQGMEFILNGGPGALIAKTGTAWARLSASWALLRRSEIYHLKLGLDLESNAQAVVDFVARRTAATTPALAEVSKSSP
jgi:hypothetical protein